MEKEVAQLGKGNFFLYFWSTLLARPSWRHRALDWRARATRPVLFGIPNLNLWLDLNPLAHLNRRFDVGTMARERATRGRGREIGRSWTLSR